MRRIFRYTKYLTASMLECQGVESGSIAQESRTEMKTDDVVASMSGEATGGAELLQRLSATFRALMWQGNKQTGDFMEHIGLTLPQAVVMWTLGAYDGIATMSDLAQMTHQSGATATGIVDRLTDAGLVER